MLTFATTYLNKKCNFKIYVERTLWLVKVRASFFRVVAEKRKNEERMKEKRDAHAPLDVNINIIGFIVLLSMSKTTAVE